jgi:arsenate reductase
VSVPHTIIVCETARQRCPRIYPFSLSTLYWPIDDPADVQGTEEDRLIHFRAVRDEIERDIRQWLAEGSATELVPSVRPTGSG